MTRWLGWVGLSWLLVGGSAGLARAQLMAPHTVSDSSAAAVRASALDTRAAKAEMAGNATEGLKLAEAAIEADPKDPWAYYDRAVALASLNRTDGAVLSFAEAEKYFADQGEPWGKSIALYGEAHALSRAGRCDQAQSAFERYASYVDQVDAASAAMARRYARECVGRQASR